MKFFSFLAVAALVVAVGVWHWGGPSAITQPIASVWQKSPLRQILPSAAQPQQPEPPATKAQIYKCVSGSRVTYSDSACPAGYQQQPVTNGAVTVMEARRPTVADTLAPSASSAPTSSASSTGNKRRLIGVPSDPALLEQEIEQATR